MVFLSLVRPGRGLVRRAVFARVAHAAATVTATSSSSFTHLNPSSGGSPSPWLIAYPASFPQRAFVRTFCVHGPQPTSEARAEGTEAKSSTEGPARAESAESTEAKSSTEGPEAKPSLNDGSTGKKDPLDEKTQVLRSALLHVPKLGWTEAAMVAGARDVGLSPAIVGIFPRKEAALVEFFMDESLQNLLDFVETHEDALKEMVLQERISKLVECRLEMQVPFISCWAQALSIQANPANVPTSFKQRAVLVDEIWHAAGDHSSDMDWYTKRGILAAVYTATELYMLTDHSSGFRDTWSFLQRRVKDAVDCRKTAQEASQLAEAIGAGLGSSLQALFRRSGL